MAVRGREPLFYHSLEIVSSLVCRSRSHRVIRTRPGRVYVPRAAAVRLRCVPRTAQRTGSASIVTSPTPIRLYKRSGRLVEERRPAQLELFNNYMIIVRERTMGKSVT